MLKTSTCLFQATAGVNRLHTLDRHPQVFKDTVKARRILWILFMWFGRLNRV